MRETHWYVPPPLTEYPQLIGYSRSKKTRHAEKLQEIGWGWGGRSTAEERGSFQANCTLEILVPPTYSYWDLQVAK